MSDDASQNESDRPGTTTPDGPSGTNKPEGTKKPEGPSGTKKPDGPPGTKKPSGPPGTKKPAGPPGSKKPAGPPGAKKPAGPPNARKASGPESAKPASKPASKPAMPPGFSGDGGGDLTRKDFSSDQDVRWCPGCGDYAILATVQRLLPEIDVKKENVVFISGIGCSGRFPYYMDTYGMHSIHGRAPAFATGLKSANPELDVWVVTGDGDALSIGGNHFIHVLRRNLNTQILLFNNKIYGLTKGQYSPTSEVGKVTMRAAHDHRGTGFLEIYQNCNIFNDGAFFEFTEKDTKPARALFVEDGEPLTYANGSKGIRLDGLKPMPVDLTSGPWSVDDCIVYDETNQELASVIGRMFWQEDLPRPFGVLYRVQRPTYEDLLHQQIEAVTDKKGEGDLDALLRQGNTWEIE